MNYTAPFVLRHDVVLMPCAELSEDVRSRIAYNEGDYTLSHRHGRSLAQVIDGETAALLALFRSPRTIVEAVVENSRALGKDPEAWLDELLPHLGRFVQKRVLVPAGSEDEQEIRPQFESGATVAGWTIVRCASLIEDSEVYQVRSGDAVAALKIARSGEGLLRALFANEEAVLRHLDGSGIAPRLLDAGAHEERPYLVVEWIAGVDASVAAAQRRHDRTSLIELCASTAAAYAELHARGVLHVDVHSRNIIFDAGKATLLDFGYASLGDAHAPAGRGGLFAYFEPEYLAGMLERRKVPASPAGEQAMVAAMLYFFIAGRHHLDFRYDRAEMSRQGAEDPPLPFAAQGVAPWPDVERILFRALEKDPSRRHASMQELAARLADVRDATVRESLATPVGAEAHALLDATLESFARGGQRFAEGFPLAPRATINYGCAGAAVGLLRIAETRGDAALLALADVWRSRAVALIGTGEDAYYNPAIHLPHEVLGDVTPYHTESGIHAAAAMVAAAMGDTNAHARALDAFLRTSRRPCAELDLTLGRCGSLVAAALLLDTAPDSAPLRAFGAETLRAIWQELDARPSIGMTKDSLGIAHGWAGYLYAALRWCAASSDALPVRLAERLDEFASLKTSKGRGAYWRIRVDKPDAVLPGWCNGTAGQVFVFTLAHQLLGDDTWLRHAELAAWNNWDEPHRGSTLCCGTAGRAYALLNFYRHTGRREWLSRARVLANHAAANAVATAARAGALWKGELGVAVLIADLASPENARMPFFE